MKRAIWTAFLLALALGLCAGARKPKALKRPAWVDNPGKEYREDKYLSAVGTGARPAAAEQQAAAKLAAIIRGEDDPYGLIVPEAPSLDRELIQVQTGKTWKDERSVHYALVWLDRAETAARYQQKLADNNTLVMNRLKAVLETGDPWKYYSILSAAGRIDAGTNILLEQLAVIAPKARAAYRADYDTEVLGFQIADAARKLRFRFDFAGPDARQLRPALEAALTERGFTLDPLGEQVIGCQLGLESSQDLKTVAYKLSLAVTDSAQKPLTGYSDSGSETGADEAEARTRALNTAQSKLEQGFRKALTDYVRSLGEP